jgi:hypothetical protein
MQLLEFAPADLPFFVCHRPLLPPGRAIPSIEKTKGNIAKSEQARIGAILKRHFFVRPNIFYLTCAPFLERSSPEHS